MREAIRLYREAIALDPQFALARARKALITALSTRWGTLDSVELVAEAHADTESTLAMAPNESEVLGAAGCAIADLGDPRRALPILERAIEENPGNAQAWAALGATQLLLGRLEAGIESLRRGLRISPADYRRSVWQTALASGLNRLRAYEETLEVAHDRSLAARHRDITRLDFVALPGKARWPGSHAYIEPPSDGISRMTSSL